MGEGGRQRKRQERLQGFSHRGCCSVAQSRPRDFGTRGLLHAAASLSLTISRSSPEFISLESVMPFSHLILFPSIAKYIHLFFNRYLPKFYLLLHALRGVEIANAKGKV